MLHLDETCLRAFHSNIKLSQCPDLLFCIFHSGAVSHPCTKNFSTLTLPSRPTMFLAQTAVRRLRLPSIASKASASLSFSRFNSTSKPYSLVEILPLEKNTIEREDINEWLTAVKTLREGKKAPETEKEIYLNQLADPEPFLQEKFQPSDNQVAEVAKYTGEAVPLPADPVIDHFTNLILRDGKKARARKQLSRALYLVYLHSRQDPVKILYETLDKMGPLFHTKMQKTGTAKSKTVPFPLNRRQRNRYAILWILEGSKKRKSSDFSVRLAEELITAWEGKLAGYDRKAQMHKAAIAHRAYIQL